jgi:hypothetical protein
LAPRRDCTVVNFFGPSQREIPPSVKEEIGGEKTRGWNLGQVDPIPNGDIKWYDSSKSLPPHGIIVWGKDANDAIQNYTFKGARFGWYMQPKCYTSWVQTDTPCSWRYKAMVQTVAPIDTGSPVVATGDGGGPKLVKQSDTWAGKWHSSEDSLPAEGMVVWGLDWNETLYLYTHRGTMSGWYRRPDESAAHAWQSTKPPRVWCYGTASEMAYRGAPPVSPVATGNTNS